MFLDAFSKSETYGMQILRQKAQGIINFYLIKNPYDCSDQLKRTLMNKISLAILGVFTRNDQNFIKTIIFLKRVRVILEFMLIL